MINQRTKTSGFTLIELLIAVAIVGIITAIAYPSYTSFITESNRTEGQRELLRMANLMEQYFLDNRAYTTDMKLLGAAASPMVTETGNYKISATVSGSTFTMTATAQGSQATADSSCKNLTITDAGVKGGTSSDCWE